jgi:putative YhbY family RNA-binding protein
MSTIELSPAERRALRARAHALRPVVTIAGNGLAASVVAELEHSLQAHELIKVRVQGVEHAQRDELMTALCAALDAAPVQHIGNILIVWRPRREEQDKAKESIPNPAPRAATAKSAAAFAATARRAALARASAEQKRNTARKERFQQGRPQQRARVAPRGGR